MPEFIDDDYDVGDPIAAASTYRAERRQKVISILKDVAADADVALKDAGLIMPLFFQSRPPVRRWSRSQRRAIQVRKFGRLSAVLLHALSGES
jgi:hypothetical protein